MTRSKGFTIIEILLVIGILIILATVTYLNFNPAKMLENSRTANAKVALTSIAKAAQIYADQNDGYAPDVNRNIPQAFIQYLGPGAWPGGPFPGSVYDWDNWEGQTCWDGTTGDIQVTLRQINDYKGKTDYTLYYVIEGPGIPHCSATTTKGECVNCPSRYP